LMKAARAAAKPDHGGDDDEEFHGGEGLVD
jgi:hypothetical protein